MSDAPDIRKVGYLAMLRRLERQAGGKPRIGQSTSLREEYVRIGQDPLMGFVESDLREIGRDQAGRPDLRNNIIGYYGPHGALPLNISEEVYRWAQSDDMAFVRFTDIFATRFQQLFFRAWSDARAISQFDHPGGDRFALYVGALLGVGTPAYHDRDTLGDINRLALAPLGLGRIKSPVKLQQMLRQDLGAAVSVEEHVPSWISFEDDSCNRLGLQGSSLGRDMYLGARAQTVDEKLRLHVRTRSLDEYRRFLPGGAAHGRMRDIVNWYLGPAIEVDVVLSLPAGEVRLAQIGKTAELGWMAVLEAAEPPPPTTQVAGARYALSVAA